MGRVGIQQPYGFENCLAVRSREVSAGKRRKKGFGEIESFVADRQWLLGELFQVLLGQAANPALPGVLMSSPKQLAMRRRVSPSVFTSEKDRRAEDKRILLGVDLDFEFGFTLYTQLSADLYGHR